jgi:glycerophosphoryl diester phosphodiesterase
VSQFQTQLFYFIMVKQPLTIAHRGASADAPENTMAAFLLAEKQGADMIELDVHFSKDGQVVVMHDSSLNRTTNGKGKIIDCNYSDLKKLDAGIKFSNKFKGEKIPLLEDVIKKIQLPLLIEVKRSGRKSRGIEKKIIKIISEHHAEHRCFIQSFETSVLKNFKALDSNLPLYKLVTGNIPILPLHIDSKLQAGKITRYKWEAINPNHLFVTESLVKKIHAKDKKIFTWTVNKKEDMKKLIDFGVDGIITNYPAVLKSILDKS